VAVKQLQERSQTPVSNLVEPPSSACSEFSTLAPAPTQSERQAVEDLLQQHLGELPDDILRELRMANANSDKGQVATPPVAIVSLINPGIYNGQIYLFPLFLVALLTSSGPLVLQAQRGHKVYLDTIQSL